MASPMPGVNYWREPMLRIIRRHNGHVWVHGKENEGAKFYFTIGLVND